MAYEIVIKQKQRVLPIEERKYYNLGFLTTDKALFDEIERLAAAANLKKSAFIRELVLQALGKVVIEPIKKQKEKNK